MSNANQQVRARQLWGSDVYTEDSDLVAALMHAGFYSISLPACPPAVSLLWWCMDSSAVAQVWSAFWHLGRSMRPAVSDALPAAGRLRRYGTANS